ncbi:MULTISPECIES: PfkB family carbohydrate kinase [Sulfitobacter]|uniref:PfkB family carbohydrate kinase n=1 Tax=Sulfitobacter profundi TaxID=2679961 RepID=A0ABW1Z2F8_9RHOB|nr:PfkB family carbohydrate kinase [Sulfitobacter indolifex]
MKTENATSPRLIAFGDNDVDCYEPAGLMYPGGNALNVAVFARRAGADAAYIGAMGNDPAGDHMRATLRAEGVDISRLRSVAGRSAHCMIRNSSIGEREFLSADLGVSIIAPEPEDLQMIANAHVVHTGRSSHVVPYLSAFANRSQLSFDFADQMTPDYIAQVAPYCYLANLSGGELSDADVISLQTQVRAQGATWCLITRGEKGAVLFGPDTEVSAQPIAANVIDTLGAGDSFIARTLVGLLRKEPPQSLMNAAAQTAAETCAQRGGFGHPAPIEIDGTHAMPISNVHAHAAKLAARAMQRNANKSAPAKQSIKRRTL